MSGRSPILDSTGGSFAFVPPGTQSAHTVLAGPTSGAAALPTFRLLLVADISDFPNLSAVYEQVLAFTAPLLRSGDTISIRVADGTQSGIISAADWSTFNGKQAALGFTPVPNTRTVTTASPLDGGGALSGNLTISISAANALNDGYLTAGDWNTFNGKEQVLAFTAPLLRSAGTISIRIASASQSGALLAADWSAFNAKQAALGFTPVPNTRTVLTTSPLSGGGALTGDLVLTLSAASAINDGYLSAADWNIFNGKQAAFTAAAQYTFFGNGTGSSAVPVFMSAATARTALALVIGTNVQAWNAHLDTWAAKTPYAGELTITNGRSVNITNNLTFAGVDGSQLNIGAGGTLGTAAFTAASAYATTAQGTKADNAIPSSYLSTDGALAANSDAKVASQKAVKTYADTKVPYTVYVALLNQSGTAAPVATVLQNTLGGTVVWNRTVAGQYLGTLAAAFPAGKTFITTPAGFAYLDVNGSGAMATRNSASAILVASQDSGAPSDSILSDLPIEIRVYP